MDDRWDFFKKGDTSLGVFYPLHYVVAGYRDLDDAKLAEDEFRKGGVAADDVRAVPGGFVASRLETPPERSALEKLGNDLVNFVGTEKGYIKEDKNHAAHGGAFLFVYAPDDEDVDRAKTRFATHPPMFARRYLRIAIEQIVKNPDSI